MKVYCVIYEFEDSDETVEGIFGTLEKAKNYLCKLAEVEPNDNNVVKILDEYVWSLVEWEIDTNEKKRIVIT